MTKLTKTIRRGTVHTRHQGRVLVVSLEAGDCISFRPKGRRTAYRTTLAACFHMAAKAEAREQARLTAAARREGKGGRR